MEKGSEGKIREMGGKVRKKGKGGKEKGGEARGRGQEDGKKQGREGQGKGNGNGKGEGEGRKRRGEEERRPGKPPKTAIFKNLIFIFRGYYTHHPIPDLGQIWHVSAGQ